MVTSSAAGPSPAAIIPAQVDFLAIFNPSLGHTDETLDDQIVYYSSLDAQSQRRRRNRRARPTENVSQAERNERLRQIGLAQGMVNFGKNFSGDQAVDTIETEKTRVVLHELEPGWWILACIDLTRLPLSPPSTKKSKDAEDPGEEKFEYSSREVKPASLLLQDLLRVHCIFLLHHDSSLSALFLRVKRTKFTSILGRYWDLFLPTWNVLLHGNPVRNVFRGIKIAASGELGIGVGEEERGSGEREVLEGLVGRVVGLVDVVVSKFGEGDPDNSDKKKEKAKDEGQTPHTEWLGTAKEPGAEDGAIFLGVGALSRKSVRDIAHWMEDVYTWGENAYGVLESPKASRRPARRAPPTAEEHTRKSSAALPLQIPPSLIQPERGMKSASSPQPETSSPEPGTRGDAPSATAEEENRGLEKYMDYLKLGYGKYWSLGGDSGGKDSVTTPDDDIKDSRLPPEGRSSKGDDSVGHFLIGRTGAVEEGWVEDPEERRVKDVFEQEGLHTRNMVRTVTVELETEASNKAEMQFSKILGSHDTDLSFDTGATISHRVSFDSQDRNKAHKLRVVLYVIKPFMFTFLFELRTEALALEGLYRSLHHQVAPLRKHLSNSTAYRPEKPDTGSADASIYDLVWDPKEITVHCNIPNIPDTTEMYSGNEQPPWSRVEALNTHMQILNVYKATRADVSELERTCKTSRGWWIVWNRILERKATDVSSNERERASSEDSSSRSSIKGDMTSDVSIPSSTQTSTTRDTAQDRASKEIFLIRKASDHAGHGRSVSLTGSTSGAGWADGASRLAQGIGVDTRKYIEGLLSLPR